jgi:hypothetical protein
VDAKRHTWDWKLKPHSVLIERFSSDSPAAIPRNGAVASLPSEISL